MENFVISSTLDRTKPETFTRDRPKISGKNIFSNGRTLGIFELIKHKWAGWFKMVWFYIPQLKMVFRSLWNKDKEIIIKL